MKRSAWPYHHVDAGPMSSGLDSGEYNCKGVDVERYMYRAPDWNREFRHVATGWEEYQNLARKFTFIEESRTFDSITLLDSTRNIRVLLPIGRGQVFFRLGPATTWTSAREYRWCSLQPPGRPRPRVLAFGGT